MEFEWAVLQPNQTVVISQRSMISAMDIRYLVHLYQPFVGAEAVNLYMTLYYELTPGMYQSEPIQVVDLLSSLNIGIPKLFELKQRLEGIGLLKSYLREQEGERFHRFEIIAPVPAHLFFNDPLLVTLLYNHVGSKRFNLLEKRYIVPRFENEEEQTVEFAKVYQTPYNITQYKKSEDEKTFLTHEKAKVQLPRSNFDWALFTQLLKSQFISKEWITKEIKRFIETMVSYYPLSESDVVTYLIYATDFTKESIDEKVLRQTFLNSCESLKKREEYTQILTKEEPSLAVSSIPENETDEQIIEIVRAAENLSPLEFISSIKEQKNGFVSMNEQRMIVDLVNASQLSSAVVNMMIHYLLVIQDQANLNKNLVTTIGNDWAQKGIKTAMDAVNALKSREQERISRIERKNEARKVNKSSVKRNEKLPEWAKDSTPVKETPLDENQTKFLQARLNELKNSKI